MHVATLGCKLNQYESEAILAQFRTSGYETTEIPEEATVCVVNTCAVTATAERKTRSLIRSLRKKNPEATLVASGCMAERNAQMLSEIGVDLVVGNAEKEHILDFVPLSPVAGNVPVIHVGETARVTTIWDGGQVEGLSGRTRAFLKVQDGCSQKCTYCVIPKLRGVGRSLPVQTAVQRVEQFIERGFREVVITGVALGTYGFEWGWPDGLVRLIRALDRTLDCGRIRLGSIEPWAVTEELVHTVAESDHICPHLHLPVQSGDDDILHRMNRRYSSREIDWALNLAFKLRSDWGIGADIIVGFPGETEESFATTQRFLFDNPFSYLHVFPFSARPGTPASRLENDVSDSQKRRRVSTLRELDTHLRLQFRIKNLNSLQPVLFESRVFGGAQRGHAPNYLDVFVHSESSLSGTIELTRITGLLPDGVAGQLENRD